MYITTDIIIDINITITTYIMLESEILLWMGLCPIS